MPEVRKEDYWNQIENTHQKHDCPNDNCGVEAQKEQFDMDDEGNIRCPVCDAIVEELNDR